MDDGQVGQTIRVRYLDEEVNRRLDNVEASAVPSGLHFNQNEEFFLQLDSEFTVPTLPIHHEATKPEPEPAYRRAVGEILEQLIATAPGLFKDVRHYFDPTDTLRLRFFKVYGIEESLYLYLFRIDLGYRAQEHDLLERGTNDRTPAYRSSRLFGEALMVPLDNNQPRDGKDFKIRQTFSETWLGERGRGYFVQGIWIDHDLTKFFSKLFLPSGARTYPFYPFVCRYRTVCQTVVDLSPKGREGKLPFLHRALAFIGPATARIEKDLRNESFSVDLPIFRQLKTDLPSEWSEFYEALTVSAYLNDNDMKEFRVETHSVTH